MGYATVAPPRSVLNSRRRIGPPYVDAEAMKRRNMVELGRVVISRRERIVMLEPFDKGLMATTLHYAYEIRNPAEYFEDIPSIKPPGGMVELAEHILETRPGISMPASSRTATRPPSSGCSSASTPGYHRRSRRKQPRLQTSST